MQSTLLSPAQSRTTRLLAAMAALTLCLLAVAGTAHATAYRYWSYWLGENGTWVAAQTGPGEVEMTDQAVQGWRFAITTSAPSSGPDNAAVYQDLCPAEAASAPADGQLRVAVVIDAGFQADAPKGQVPPADSISCVTVPAGSTGNQALAAAAQVQESNGLICAINAYPTDECGAEVADKDATIAAQAAASESPNPAQPKAVAGINSTAGEQAAGDSGPNSATWISLAALVAIIGAAVVLFTRRRSSQ